MQRVTTPTNRPRDVAAQSLSRPLEQPGAGSVQVRLGADHPDPPHHIDTAVEPHQPQCNCRMTGSKFHQFDRSELIRGSSQTPLERDKNTNECELVRIATRWARASRTRRPASAQVHATATSAKSARHVCMNGSSSSHVSARCALPQNTSACRSRS